MYNILIKSGIFLIFSTLFVSVSLSSVQARVIVHEKVKYYSVRGKSGAQTVLNLMKTGTRVSKTRHAIATTKVKFNFKNIKVRASRKNCKVSNIDVIVSLVYTYPKWRNYNRASPKTRKNWDKFMREVRKHERKHGSIAVDAAHKVERGFKRSRGKTAKKCNDWGASIKRKIAPLIVRHHRRQAQFDKREHKRYSRITRSMIALIKGK
ncbi:MAG: DUF922 domain-containing protein [Rhizobiaceae bacterium]